MDDADTDFNDMLFFEKQAVQPSSAEKINGNEAYCDARADQTARSAVLFRKIRLFCAKAPADQCNRCGLKAVTERKRKRHNIHADLMCRHRISALFGRHDRRHHKTDAHENLLEKHTVADFNQAAECCKRRFDFIPQNIADIQKSVFLHDGTDTHHTSDNRSCDGCQCRTLNTKRREPEMAVDQKIIQDNINRIRCYIRAHRDFCIARTTLCRVDPHLDAVKNHTAHDDTEICYCAVMRLRR